MNRFRILLPALAMFLGGCLPSQRGPRGYGQGPQYQPGPNGGQAWGPPASGPYAQQGPNRGPAAGPATTTPYAPPPATSGGQAATPPPAPYVAPVAPPAYVAPQPNQVKLVRVMLRDAAIRPTKPDGQPWDCCGDIPKDKADAVSKALLATGGPHAAAAAVLVELAPLMGHGTMAPDVEGRATLHAGGQDREAIDLTGERDSYHPILSTASHGTPTWDHVPLTNDAFIYGDLRDRDLTVGGVDPIGPFTIRYRDLVAALNDQASNPSYPVVYTTGSILFIGISVFPE